MSRTLRIYSRDYDDGTARCHRRSRRKPVCFSRGFMTDGKRTIGIRWAKTPPEVIEQNHGDDDFGGWYGPSIIIDKNESIALDCSPGDDDAVVLMMTNPYRIVSLGGEIALRLLDDD